MVYEDLSGNTTLNIENTKSIITIEESVDDIVKILNHENYN